jgi:hypothetical protein
MSWPSSLKSIFRPPPCPRERAHAGAGQLLLRQLQRIGAVADLGAGMRLVLGLGLVGERLGPLLQPQILDHDVAVVADRGPASGMARGRHRPPAIGVHVEVALEDLVDALVEHRHRIPLVAPARWDLVARHVQRVAGGNAAPGQALAVARQGDDGAVARVLAGHIAGSLRARRHRAGRAPALDRLGMGLRTGLGRRSAGAALTGLVLGFLLGRGAQGRLVDIQRLIHRCGPSSGWRGHCRPRSAAGWRVA